MWFLALELWPYVLAALIIGLLTGWFSNCVSFRKALMRKDREVERQDIVQEETR